MQTLKVKLYMNLELPLSTNLDANDNASIAALAQKWALETGFANECEVEVIEPGMQFNETIVLMEDDKVIYSNGLTD